jgi:hypothetical protein
VEGGCAAEGDHGVVGEVLAVLDGVDAGGVGHVLVHHLGDAEGGGDGVHAEALAHIGPEGGLGAVGVEGDGAAGEVVGVEAAEEEVGVGHGGALAAAAVGGGAGLGALRFGAHADLAHGVHMGERAAARADLDHVDDGDAEGIPEPFLKR